MESQIAHKDEANPGKADRLDRLGRGIAGITAVCLLGAAATLPAIPVVAIVWIIAAVGFALWATRGMPLGTLAPIIHGLCAVALLPTLTGTRWCSQGCGVWSFWAPSWIGAIPVAGIFFHGLAAIGQLAMERRAGAAAVPSALWSIIPVAGSIVGVAVMVHTGMWCRWCAVVHGLMSLLVIHYAWQDWRSSTLWVAGGVAGITHAFLPPVMDTRPSDGATLAAYVRSGSLNAASPHEASASVYRGPSTATVWGSSAAPVTTIMVMEVGCPACVETWKALRPALQNDVDAGRVAVRVLLLPGAGGKELAERVAAAGALGSSAYVDALDLALSTPVAIEAHMRFLAAPVGARVLTEFGGVATTASSMVADAAILASAWGVTRAPRVWVVATGTAPTAAAALASPPTPDSLRTAIQSAQNAQTTQGSRP